MSSSNRRADLAARAAAVAGSSGARAPAGPRTESAADPAGAEAGGGPVSSRVPRTRPVRVTVELSPMEHKALRQWCAQTSADLDLPVVAGAEVFRALLSLMRGDPEVAEQVRAELERTGGSRRRH
ncbi:MAG: hypothetical protein QOF38_4097 [Pseudonocardiales bacterium]|nr:hypothetical protein [Pseudonocardiales bacterium]